MRTERNHNNAMLRKGFVVIRWEWFAIWVFYISAIENTLVNEGDPMKPNRKHDENFKIALFIKDIFVWEWNRVDSTLAFFKRVRK